MIAAARLSGVRRIGLLGSICTSKQNPKDIDFIVVVEVGIDLTPLAGHARRLKGRAQHVNRGADIFLATDQGEYLGRICHYRECWPRRLCRARHCGRIPHLNDDLNVVTLSKDVIQRPPVTVWPHTECRCALPGDVEAWLLELAAPASGGDSPPDQRSQPSRMRS